VIKIFIFNSGRKKLNFLFKKILNKIKSVIKRPKSREILFTLNKNILIKKIELIFREATYILKCSQVSEKSAQLTYISILSIVPLLAVIFTFVHAINGFNNIFIEILDPLIVKHFGNSIGLQISNYLQSIISNLELKELGIISFLTFLFTVILLILKIEDTIDEIMEFKNKVNIFNRIAKCCLIITITPFLFTIVLVKSDPFLSLISLRDFQILNTHAIKITRVTVGLLFQWIFFLFIYYIIPSKKVNFKSALIGGFVANILFELLQFVNVFLAKRALSTDPSHIYGSMPIIAVLFFVWLRLIWLIILTGASYTIASQKIIYHKNQKKLKVFPSKGLLDCIAVYKAITDFYRTQNIPSSELSISKVTNINKVEVEGWLEYLLNKKIICTANNNTKMPLYLPSYKSIIEDKNDNIFLRKILLDETHINSKEHQEILDIFNIKK
jgi:membrane protein